GPGPDAIALAMLQASRYGVATQPGVGPSDALIVFEDISDKEADILARDFLTEIEHGSDSRTYALTVDRRSAERLQNALNLQTANLFGHEATYAEIAANGNAAIILFPSSEDILSFANAFAPEHLMLYVDPPHREKYLDELTAVGELLIGKSTPFTAANYCIGVTHVLPTSGFARAYSGITSRQFVRHTTTAELEPSALRRLLPTVEAIGGAEGLPNHVQAVKARHA
ncbi:MAG TPA: histidinol dehydrogenase, partial [Candidatus Baltobacteraceae bacterium]|nr:histidinol dehydrogenase [Candidatus Baltobacteraceae bacterium]